MAYDQDVDFELGSTFSEASFSSFREFSKSRLPRCAVMSFSHEAGGRVSAHPRVSVDTAGIAAKIVEGEGESFLLEEFPSFQNLGKLMSGEGGEGGEYGGLVLGEEIVGRAESTWGGVRNQEVRSRTQVLSDWRGWGRGESSGRRWTEMPGEEGDGTGRGACRNMSFCQPSSSCRRQRKVLASQRESQVQESRVEGKPGAGKRGTGKQGAGKKGAGKPGATRKCPPSRAEYGKMSRWRKVLGCGFYRDVPEAGKTVRAF